MPSSTRPERLAVVALASQKRALVGSAAAVACWIQRLDSGWPVAELYDGEEGGEVWGEGAEDDEEDEEGGGQQQQEWDDWGGGRKGAAAGRKGARAGKR